MLRRLLINSVKFKTSGSRSGREEWVYIWLLASGSNSWLQSQLAWEWTAVFPRDINFMAGKGGGNSGVQADTPPQQKIGSALDLRMSLLSKDPRWHGQMPRRMHHHLYCWEGWWSPGRTRGPFFMLDCSRQHFSFRFVQALAEAFTTKCDLQSKDPIYFSPPSLEETSLWGRKKKKRKDEKRYLYFLS